MSGDHLPAARILAHLDTVTQLRAARQGDPALQARVQALKAYQARRFSLTYADLLASARYGAAARFFLDELYGPQEFAQRDAQFARVVPALVKLFPDEVVHTVAQLGQLHALSEALDDQMARQLTGPNLGPTDYLRAWQATGREDARRQQITLTLQVGQTLDRLTRKRMLRTTLRLMRGPAEAAGLADLQRFLESGFDAFGAMQGAAEFLAWVNEREQALVSALFAADAKAPARGVLALLPARAPALA